MKRILPVLVVFALAAAPATAQEESRLEKLVKKLNDRIDQLEKKVDELTKKLEAAKPAITDFEKSLRGILEKFDGGSFDFGGLLEQFKDRLPPIEGFGEMFQGMDLEQMLEMFKGQFEGQMPQFFDGFDPEELLKKIEKQFRKEPRPGEVRRIWV